MPNSEESEDYYSIFTAYRDVDSAQPLHVQEKRQQRRKRENSISNSTFSNQVGGHDSKKVKELSYSTFSDVFRELGSAMPADSDDTDCEDEEGHQRIVSISSKVTSKIYKLPSSAAASTNSMQIAIDTTSTSFAASRSNARRESDVLSPPKTPKRKDSLPGSVDTLATLPNITPRGESIAPPARTTSRKALATSVMPSASVPKSNRTSPITPISAESSSTNTIFEMYESLATLTTASEPDHFYQGQLMVSINHAAPQQKWCAMSHTSAFMIYNSYEERSEFDYMNLDSACTVHLSRSTQIMIQDEAENIIVVQSENAEAIKQWYNVLKAAVLNGMDSFNGKAANARSRSQSVSHSLKPSSLTSVFGKILGRRPSQPF